MIEAQFNMFDAAVLIVMVLSTLLAFFRGFVREFLSLGAWVGAGMTTIYFFNDVVEWLKPHVSQEIVAYLLGGVGTYVAALLSFSVINSIIIRYVRSSDEIGMFDNFLGMIFGGMRGAFIISLGFLVLTLVTDEKNPPAWVENAATKDLAQQGALILARVAPGYLQDISSLGDKLERKIAQNTPDEEPSSDRIDIFEAGESSLEIDKNKGYSDQERFLLDQIMRSRK